jgi:hypothetical protein
VAGLYVASKSPDLHCGDAQWRAALIAFVPLALWVIGMPIWLAYALWRARQDMSGAAPTGVAVPGERTLCCPALRPFRCCAV